MFDRKETVELVINLLCSGGRAALFSTTHQLALWHRFFAVAPSSQHDGSSPSSFSGSRKMYMVSAAPSTFVDHAVHHRSNP